MNHQGVSFLGFTVRGARFLSVAVLAFGLSVSARGVDRNRWMAAQAEVSLRYLLANISPPGTEKGVVVASPSKAVPNYWFHWTRDGALVMNVVADLYRFTRNSVEKAYYRKALVDYIHFSRRNQLTKTQSGLGEPKFLVNGGAFNDPWGRPQNDGPALRAITLIKVAAVWLAEGQEAEVRRLLYDGKQPTGTVIKEDLEFVSHNWADTCFDLWEEVRGHHFYTRLVQYRALAEGARLAYALGDRGAGDFYVVQARALQQELARFWDAKANYLLTTLNRVDGIGYKSSNLDSSVILAALHAYTGDGFFSVTDDRVLASFQKNEEVFNKLYPVNSKGYPAVAIGRYPEDRYDGIDVSEGNPWVLTTLGFGELLHRAAAEFTRKGRIDVNQVNLAFFRSLGVAVTSRKLLTTRDAQFGEIITKLRGRGDDYIARAGFHGFKDGRFSEQINRHTGNMQGAHDLTWSYAAFITAYWGKMSR